MIRSSYPVHTHTPPPTRAFRPTVSSCCANAHAKCGMYKGDVPPWPRTRGAVVNGLLLRPFRPSFLPGYCSQRLSTPLPRSGRPPPLRHRLLPRAATSIFPLAHPSPVTRQILKFCLLRSPPRWLPRCRWRLCAISRRLGLECSRLTRYTLIVNVNANAKCQMPIRNSRMGLGAWTGRRPDDAHDEQTRVPRARSARPRLFRGRCGGLPRQVLRHVLGRSMDG